jgi:hypothetical protein
LARYWRIRRELASTEFDQFYPRPAQSWQRATHEDTQTSDDAQAALAKSSALTN